MDLTKVHGEVSPLKSNEYSKYDEENQTGRVALTIDPVNGNTDEFSICNCVSMEYATITSLDINISGKVNAETDESVEREKALPSGTDVGSDLDCEGYLSEDDEASVYNLSHQEEELLLADDEDADTGGQVQQSKAVDVKAVVGEASCGNESISKTNKTVFKGFPSKESQRDSHQSAYSSTSGGGETSLELPLSRSEDTDCFLGHEANLSDIEDVPIDSQYYSCSDTETLLYAGDSSPLYNLSSSEDNTAQSVGEEDFDTTLDHLSNFFDTYSFVTNCNADIVLPNGSSIGTSFDSVDMLMPKGSKIGSLGNEDNSLAKGANIDISLNNDNFVAKRSTIGTSFENDDTSLAKGSSIGTFRDNNDNFLSKRSNIGTSLDINDNSLAKVSKGATFLATDNQLLIEGSNIVTSLDINDNSLAKVSKGVTSLTTDNQLLIGGSNIVTSLDINDNSLAKVSKGVISLATDNQSLIGGSNIVTSLDINDNSLAKVSKGVISLATDNQSLIEGSNIVTSLDINDNSLAKVSNRVTSLECNKSLVEGLNIDTCFDNDCTLVFDTSDINISLDDVKSNITTPLDNDKLLAQGSNIGTLDNDKLLAHRSNIGTPLDNDKLLAQESNIGTPLNNNKFADIDVSFDADTLMIDASDISISLDDDKSVYSISSTEEDLLLADEDDVVFVGSMRPDPRDNVITLNDSEDVTVTSDHAAEPVASHDRDAASSGAVVVSVDSSEVELVAAVPEEKAEEGEGDAPRVAGVYTPRSNARSWPAFSYPPLPPDSPPPPEPARGGGWQEVFVSSDPAENRDNFDPRWEEVRGLRTDEERYNALKKGWRNLRPPNPNENLTSRLVWRGVAPSLHPHRMVAQSTVLEPLPPDWAKCVGIESPDHREDNAWGPEDTWENILQRCDAESGKRRRSRSVDSAHRRPLRGTLRRRGRSTDPPERGGSEPRPPGSPVEAPARGEKRPREDDDEQLPPAKRPRTVACKKLYEDMLREAVWLRDERLAAMDSSHCVELADLQRRQHVELALFPMRDVHQALVGLALQQAQVRNNLCLRQNTERQQLLQQYESRINVLESALQELTIFYNFYKGVTTEDSSFLTDVEVQELIEVEDTLNNYSSIYRN